MKSGSKRGAALAYVIVITAALMILAAALVSAAKFNIDYSQNSLEGRQAYLDAKSAIEYGRAYLQSNPDSGDFTVVYASDASGFKIGAANATNTAAKYSATARTINATGKYKSSDRVRRLGYRMATADTPVEDNLQSFFIGGNGYGTHTVLSVYNYNLTQDASSVYPFICHTYLQTTGTNKLAAPQIYILGQANGDCLKIYDTNTVTLQSDFIYLAGGINTFKNYLNEYQPLNLETFSNKNQGVIFFQKDVIKNNIRIAQGGKYYLFKNHVNLYNLAVGDLQEISASDLTNAVNKDNIDFIVSNNNNIVSGDGWDKCRGTQWAIDGKLGLGMATKAGDKNSWVYQDSIANKIVYCYVNDCTGWSSVFRDYSNNVTSAIYNAKEINLQYVNSGENFVVPANRTLIFKADKISLNTQQSDTELGTVGTKPKITFDGVDTLGSYSSFILQSADGKKQFDLTCPNDIAVYYSDSQHQQQTYIIDKGTYHIVSAVGVPSGIGMNLFTYAAQTYFGGRKPDSPSGGSGSSGGGTEVTGGVYTDG